MRNEESNMTVMTVKEYGESVNRQNVHAVEKRLWTAIRFTLALVFLAPLAVFLVNIDRFSDWYGIRVGIGVFTILEGLATGFAWLWWRGARQNAGIERGFLKDGDVKGLEEYRFLRDKPWEWYGIRF